MVTAIAGVPPTTSLHLRRLWVLLLVVFLACGLNDSIIAQQVESTRPTAQLAVLTERSPLAVRDLAEILSTWRAGDFVRVREELNRFRERHRGGLVEVAPLHKIEASLIADLLIARIPAQGTSRSDPSEAPPPLPLLSVAGSAPVLTEVRSGELVESLSVRASAHSLWRAVLRREISTVDLLDWGSEFWSQGDVQQAELCWRIADWRSAERLSNWPQALPLDAAEQQGLAIRRLIADLYAGRLRQADSRWQRFAAEYPEATGRLAGREGALATILEELIHEVRREPEQQLLPVPQLRADQHVRFHWGDRLWSSTIQATPEQPAHITPVGKQVLIHDLQGTRALQLNTGRPAWPVDAADHGEIWKYPQENLLESSVAPLVNPVVPNGMLAGDWWVGRTGMGRPHSARLLPQELQSRLSVLNLSAEGRLEWSLVPDALLSSQGVEATRSHNTSFAGPPLVATDSTIPRVYIPLREQGPGWTLRLAAVDLQSGQPLWVSTIGANRHGELWEPRDFHDALVRLSGVVYWSIDGLAIACVEERTGEVLWLVGSDQEMLVQAGDRAQESSLLIDQNRVLMSTPRGVMAVDAFTGERLWNVSLSAGSQGAGSQEAGPQQLLGISDGICVAIGATGELFGIETRTGRLVWSHLSESPLNSQARQRPAGQLLGGSLLWCTGDELWLVETRSGKLQQREFLSELTGRPVNGATLLPVQTHSASSSLADWNRATSAILILDQQDRLTAYAVESLMTDLPQ